MKRVVSVWTPDWPITRVDARRAPTPGARRRLRARPSPWWSAGRTGLTPLGAERGRAGRGPSRGQAHADARAIVPDLVSAPAEPERDLEALRRLALWAERYSPCVAVDAASPAYEGLLIDMTGGAHLFGGEAALLADLRARLARAGAPARLAIADTPAAAWGLARFSGEDEALAAARPHARSYRRACRWRRCGWRPRPCRCCAASASSRSAISTACRARAWPAGSAARPGCGWSSGWTRPWGSCPNP